jgi:hypothetical protein
MSEGVKVFASDNLPSSQVQSWILASDNTPSRKQNGP